MNKPATLRAFLTQRLSRMVLLGILLIALGAFAIIVPKTAAANRFAMGVAASGATLPSNFTRVTVASGLQHPVQMRFAPNGDMYIAEQCGTIVRYHNGAIVSPVVIAVPNTQCDIERGLLGIALDGNFATNGYLYAAYTNTDGHSRLSRFSVVNGVANPNTETILYKFTQPSAIYHNINDVEWGPDGKLWVSVGDGYTCGSFCGAEAQQLTSPHGKLLRFNPDGSVPTDNPYPTAAAPQSYIWSLGYRSPFRFTFLANGTPMVGDVGVRLPNQDKWQRFNLATKLSNFGWSSYIYRAPCTSPPQANLTNCPFYEYINNPVGANAITGFLQYEGNAYPSSFKNVLFYSEYGNQTLHYLTFTDNTYTHVAADAVFDATADTTVDLEMGPDGNLYSTVIYQNSIYKYIYSGPPNPTPTPTSLQISNLIVADTANAANWSVQNNLQVGNTQYGDRGYTLTSVPSSLLGSTWIRSADNSKSFIANPTVSFTLNEAATLYVAIDTRLSQPSWIDASWANSGLTLTNTEVTPPHIQDLFEKTFQAGTVVLGPVSSNAANSYLMYSVIAVPNGSPPPPPTPTPPANTPTATPTNGSGLQVSGLTVADGAHAAAWSVQSNLQVGTVQYGDRGFTFATVPASLVGATWIQTANASKVFTANPTATFTINQGATVDVAFDTRTPVPAWVDGTWTKTALVLTNNEGAGADTFVVYSKAFPAGPVTLGPNDTGNTGLNMYSVILQPTGAPPPTPTPTSGPTNTPTATPTSGSGLQVSGLTVADGAHAAAWSVQGNLQVGTVQYGDRGFTFATVPASLVGATWIRTANASKTFTANPTVSFTINQGATVGVAFDTRTPVPAWVDGTWTKTALVLTNNEGAGANTFVIYSKAFPAGPVTLGPNDTGNTGLNMYSVILQ